MPNLCHIHNSFSIPSKSDVHNKICNLLSTSPTKYSDGKYYCALHLPDEGKNLTDFKKAINEINSSVKSEIKNIKNASITDAEKESKLNDLAYDFRYVFFPKDYSGGFNMQTFDVLADFGWTTFTENALFAGSSFKKDANFTHAVFKQGAGFTSTLFCSDAVFDSINSLGEIWFQSAIFLKTANFNRSEFSQNTYFLSPETGKRPTVFCGNVFFNSAKFSGNISFNSTIFIQDVYFQSTQFEINSTTNFQETKFCGKVDFGQASFNGYVFIESATGNRVFLKSEEVSTLRSSIKRKLNPRFSLQEINLEKINSCFEKNQESFLVLQNSKFENIDMLSFRGTILRPSWFIKTEPQKIEFKNCKWDNVNKFLIGVKDEIQYTKEKLNTNDAEYFLKETVKKLAINSEELNRYEEASLFRRVSFEIEKHQNKKIIKNWFQKGRYFQKDIDCSPFSIKFYRNFKFCAKEVFEEIGTLPSLIIYYIYSFLSGYGESPNRSASVLIVAVFFIFPIIYTQTDFQVSPKTIPLEVVVVSDCDKMITNKDGHQLPCYKIKNGGLYFWNEAILHSLTSVTLQDVEYRKPISFWAEFWTILEKIFAPLQAALLALAIRRKFMR